MITIPTSTPPMERVAWLLATIGAAPQSATDLGWLQTVSAFRFQQCLYADEHPAVFSEAVPVLVAGDLRLREALRERRLKFARLNIERAMLAAHAAMPHVVQAAHQHNGPAMALTPRAYRQPADRTQQINRTLEWEERLLEYLREVGMAVVPPRAPASGNPIIDQRNFRTRVLARAQPVLHLAIGLAQAVDRAEREIHRITGTRETWEALGYGSYPVAGAEGEIAFRPRMTEMHVLAHPGVSALAINIAETLRPAVEKYLTSGRTRDPKPLIRLLHG
jgi:hypothetical protein